MQCPIYLPASNGKVLRRVESCLLCSILDDIIVFGRTLDEHIERLEKVIDRLASHGFKMEPSKCGLLQRKVQYLVDNLLDPQHIDPQFVRERKEGQKAKQKEHYDKCAPCGDCLEAIIRHIILSSVRWLSSCLFTVFSLHGPSVNCRLTHLYILSTHLGHVLSEDGISTDPKKR